MLILYVFYKPLFLFHSRKGITSAQTRPEPQIQVCVFIIINHSSHHHQVGACVCVCVCVCGCGCPGGSTGLVESWVYAQEGTGSNPRAVGGIVGTSCKLLAWALGVLIALGVHRCPGLSRDA